MDAARARQDKTTHIDGLTGHNLSLLGREEVASLQGLNTTNTRQGIQALLTTVTMHEQ